MTFPQKPSLLSCKKPLVFLSHSRKDIQFIEQVEKSLLGCYIQTWRDETEIRHGRSWLDSIFDDGIPRCDTVLVYLTSNSIESDMVKKEIDASLIRRLDDSNIGIILYVSSSELRNQLRSDLKTLQIPKWNDENYYDMLPRVVAEIWRNFKEATIDAIKGYTSHLEKQAVTGSTDDEHIKYLRAMRFLHEKPMEMYKAFIVHLCGIDEGIEKIVETNDFDSFLIKIEAKIKVVQLRESRKHFNDRQDVIWSSSWLSQAPIMGKPVPHILPVALVKVLSGKRVVLNEHGLESLRINHQELKYFIERKPKFAAVDI